MHEKQAAGVKDVQILSRTKHFGYEQETLEKAMGILRQRPSGLIRRDKGVYVQPSPVDDKLLSGKRGHMLIDVVKGMMGKHR